MKRINSIVRFTHITHSQKRRAYNKEVRNWAERANLVSAQIREMEARGVHEHPRRIGYGLYELKKEMLAHYIKFSEEFLGYSVFIS